MKKIFTLIAVAMMAVGANAQQFKVAADDQFTVGQKVTSVADITMTFGGSTTPYLNKKGDKTLTDAYKKAAAHATAFASVGYDASTDGNGNNPVGDDNGSSTTPTRGTYYVFEPTAAGNLEVAGVFNADKTVVVSEDGTDITSTISYAGTQEDGTLADDFAFVDNTFNYKLYGTITFAVKAGSKYYVMIQGSKLGFAGFKFPATAAGINGVEAAATAAPAVKKYVENGQIVIEKAGKKFTAAGAQLK